MSSSGFTGSRPNPNFQPTGNGGSSSGSSPPTPVSSTTSPLGTTVTTYSDGSRSYSQGPNPNFKGTGSTPGGTSSPSATPSTTQTSVLGILPNASPVSVQPKNVTVPTKQLFSSQPNFSSITGKTLYVQPPKQTSTQYLTIPGVPVTKNYTPLPTQKNTPVGSGIHGGTLISTPSGVVEQLGIATSTTGKTINAVYTPATPKPQGVYDTMNSFIKQHITEPLLTTSTIKALTYNPISTGIESLPNKNIPFLYNKQKIQGLEDIRQKFATGTLEGIREEPLKEGLIFGATIVAPEIFGLAGKTGTAIATGLEETRFAPYIPTASKVVQVGTKIGGGILAGAYALDVGGRISQSNNKVETAGKIFGSEFVPFIGGSIVATKGIPALKGLLRTRGLTEIPSSSIIDESVLNDQTFTRMKPGQSVGSVKQEFFGSKLPSESEGTVGSFHATPKEFSSETKVSGEVQRPKDVSGLYVAPKLSPYFLRISGETGGSFRDVLNANLFDQGELFSGKKPAALRIALKDVRINPLLNEESTNFANLGRTQEFFRGEIPGLIPEKGVAYVPFVKGEKEAVITADTLLSEGDRKYFFTYKNVRVPIQEFFAEGVSKTPSNDFSFTKQKISVPSSSAELKTFGELSNEYYFPNGKSSYPLLNFGYVTKGSSTSLSKPYDISYDKNVFSSYDYTLYPKNYHTPSYNPKIPPYELIPNSVIPPPYKPIISPPKTPVYLPPYQPPYTPPYQPPIVPIKNPPYYQPPYEPPYTPPLYPPFFPGFDGGSNREYKIKSKAKYREYTYVPSLISKLFNIRTKVSKSKARQIVFSEQDIFGYEGINPILDITNAPDIFGNNTKKNKSRSKHKKHRRR